MKIVKKNKRAHFDYFLLKTFIAGIILHGPEVKEIKSGHITLDESYVRVKEDGVYLWNANVSTNVYSQITTDREKKLLLNAREIKEIRKDLEQRGLTIIPTAVGLDHGLVKVEIAVARGKKKFDKRETVKKRDTERMLRRIDLGKAERVRK